MNYYPFDERKILYRSKLSAVASDESITLRLLVHNDAHCYNAFLLIKKDGEEFEYLKMTENGAIDNYRIFERTVLKDTGLYFYAFKYESEYGDFFVSKTDGGLGTFDRELKDLFQLTVYDKNFKTPDWLKGGIIYQIFPDRFYCSGKEKKNVPSDRFIQTDKSAIPEHRQSENLKTLGNDYFCGDIKGITEKLPYLKKLNVTLIYLNPIFEAHSNHRYNTADYLKIDSLLGDENDLKELCKTAKKYGISVMLDGVFSHTGDDSIYFNKYNRYESTGAYQSVNSQYFEWYKFEEYPEKYKSWWGVKTLPETVEENESFAEFITGKKGVLKHYLNLGVKGYRLDVADELPDCFLEKIRKSIKEESEDNFLLGEVWEDATNKISYGKRRKFLLGSQLDSVMNYPFANAICDFIKNGNSKNLNETVLSVCLNYPPQALCLNMNHIGTHDTARALTLLSDTYRQNPDRDWQAEQTLNESQYSSAKSLLKLAAVVQYTLPGVPSVFYGDEAGTYGYSDPFCRKYFDWDNIDNDLLSFYKALGKMRKGCSAFIDGQYCPIYEENGFLCYERIKGNVRSLIAVNRSGNEREIVLDGYYKKAKHVLGVKPESEKLLLKPDEFCFIY